MKLWKLLLGLGAACAACCAIPLLGGAALVSSAAALWACADELLPVAMLMLGVAAFWFWRRQVARRAACECPTACATGGDHACR